MGKKIGIITMHKVTNYGSALQAYALQRVIEDMGHSPEIIDYVYPNSYHNSFKKTHIIKKFLHRALKICRNIRSNKLENHFDKFYSRHFKLSRIYYTKEQLSENPPVYDLYMTGSDQVWNPCSIYEDTSFMLSFTQNSNKVAYAASFSKGEIPEQYQKLYASELRKYKYITMREESGAQLIQQLINQKAEVVLDPTLLINRNQWLDLAINSTNSINGPYILIYVLGYSFEVYPYIYDLICHVQKQMALPCVILNMKESYSKLLKNNINVTNPSIYDFIDLFAKASLVLTDSFHGTAFSLNLGTPFYSVINENSNEDSRVLNLLKIAGEESRAIKRLSDFTKIDFKCIVPSTEKLEVAKTRSLDQLEKMLNL